MIMDPAALLALNILSLFVGFGGGYFVRGRRMGR